jgi:diketogulonate reductase-like aldo/keto reductase
LTPDSLARRNVSIALEAGYRLIDTAKIYDNETGVGEAIRESRVDRQELFVATKLWNDDQGYDSTMKACQASLDMLGLDYLDLYLIHWPATSRRNDSWRALIELQKQRKVKAIGVSNYTVRHLEELMNNSGVIPTVNQVEFHPFIYQQQKKLLTFCGFHNILIEAYSPLSRLTKNVHPVIQKIATQIGKSPNQVVLRWCIQHGTVPLPRSQDQLHIKANFDIFDFELSDDVMAALDGISDGVRVTWDPEGMR